MPDDTNPDQSTSQPVSLTAEQLTQIVNSAITSHLKRLPDPKALIAEALAAYKPPQAAVTPDTSAEDKPAKTGKMDPQVAALSAKLDEMTKAYNDALTKQQAAEKQAREDRALSDLKAALVGKVRPEAVADVAALLYQVHKKVELDEQGNALFKAQVAPAQGFAPVDTLLPLQDGVDHWLKSPAASIYAVAPGATPTQGTPQQGAPKGSRMPQQKIAAPKYDGPPKTEQEKIQRAMAQEQYLKSQGF